MKIEEIRKKDCKQALANHLGNSARAKKIRAHSERVYRICKEIYENPPSTVVRKINKEMLYRASFLHDIAKFDDNGIHNMIEGIIIKEYFNELDCDDLARLCSVIRCQQEKI